MQTTIPRATTSAGLRWSVATLVAFSAAAAASVGPARAAVSNAYYDVRFPFNGVHVVAPADVHIAGMHPLRQQWTVATTVKDIAPPDLSFLNVGSGGSAAGGAGPDTRSCKDTTATLQTLTVTDQTRAACAQLLLTELSSLRNDVARAKIAEASVITGIDEILRRHPDLRTESALSAYATEISVCVFGPRADTCPAGMQTIPAIRTTLVALRNVLNTINADSEQISLRTGALPKTDEREKQLFSGVQSSVTALAADADKVQAYYDGTLAPLTIGRFVYEADAIRCGGLFNHGQETQIVMTLQTNDTRDLTVVCTTPVFVSVGFGADGLDNRTFTTVAANTAGQPAPVAGATPVPSSIVENGTGQRALAVTLANVQLGTSPLYYSLGIGAAVFGGSAGKVDLLTGLSWTDRRSVVVTAGFAFGRSQRLAPGYTIGGPIAPGATPPTVNRNSSAFFAGITFAK